MLCSWNRGRSSTPISSRVVGNVGGRFVVSGHRKFGELAAPVLADPERRARVEEHRRELREELRLADLRRARGFTQRQLAAVMETEQPGIARLEKQADLY